MKPSMKENTFSWKANYSWMYILKNGEGHASTKFLSTDSPQRFIEGSWKVQYYWLLKKKPRIKIRLLRLPN